MHEMSLSQSMLDIIRDQAVSQGFHRVNLVRLEIGSLSCVAPDALYFCFDSVMRGTLADGAKLEIITVPGTAYCWDCEASITIERRGDACPSCGGYLLQVQGGDEMRIKELEVE